VAAGLSGEKSKFGFRGVFFWFFFGQAKRTRKVSDENE